MSLLAEAIHSGQWELAALCLALGTAQRLALLPEDAVEGLLDVLIGDGRWRRENRPPLSQDPGEDEGGRPRSSMPRP